MNFQIMLYELKAAFLAACTDLTRETINHVLVELKASNRPRVVGTSGTHLILVDSICNQATEDAEVLIPRNMFLLLERISRTDREINCQVDNRLTMDSGTVSISCTLSDLRFPKYQQVLPSRDAGNMKYVSLNHRLLGSVGEAAALVAKCHDKQKVLLRATRTPAVRITQHQENDPYCITVRGLDEFLGVVMPVRPS